MITRAGGARRFAEERLASFRARREALAAQDRQLSWARGVTFALSVLAWWLAVGPEVLPAWTVFAGFAGFAALVAAHARVASRARHAARGAALYERTLARLDDRWMGQGTADDFAPEGHPYAADIDLFGGGSLFERLDATRSGAGRRALAQWLLVPAPAAEVRLRQQAVGELRQRTELREDLALAGEHAGEGHGLDALSAWAQEPHALPAWAPAAAAVLAAGNVAGLSLFLAEAAGPDLLFVSALASFAFSVAMGGRTRAVTAGVDAAARELALVASLAARLERESFASPALRVLAIPGAARRMRRLVQLVDLLDAMRNVLFAPVGALVLWRLQVAAALGRWRARHGRDLVAWAAAVGEAEALLALSAYAWERPDDPFPDLAESGPLFEAEGLAHPLLGDAVAVANDLRLGGDRPLLLVSGSNMSGKSTLLRAVGTNVVLAFAGAPVRARRLVVSPLALGASLRVHDSLLAGRSRFLAEIERLKAILDLAAAGPTLFLLDEVLQGTNSADRRVGAEALLGRLLATGAIGLVTTHDLALAEIADALAPRARNVHFEDRLSEGGLEFDYRLREGVVRHGNALALMRSVGLEV